MDEEKNSVEELKRDAIQWDFTQNLLFSNLTKVKRRDLNSGTRFGEIRRFTKKFNKDDIIKFLDNPESHEKQLRDVSNLLYNKSSHYKRLIQYFAKMPLFYYMIKPYNINVDVVNPEKYYKQYKRIINKVENMNLEHELTKVFTMAFRNDVFYGYAHETKDSFYIQPLPADYCAISHIEDGCFVYSFDFSYFGKDEGLLDKFPDEFESKYRRYQDNPKERWIEIDSKNAICVKVNEDLNYAIPPFAGVFDSVLDIEDYKSLIKAREEIDNYKLVGMKIPLRDKSTKNNDFSIEFDVAEKFYNMAANVLPEQVGLILTPMELEDINFKKDSVDSDMVAKAERDYWSATGVSSLLFNNEKAGTTSLTKSIQTDEDIVFALLRQVERWVNRKLKDEGDETYTFKVNFLNITQHNKDDYFDKVLKAAQFGIPCKTEIPASLGMSPSDVMQMQYLENDILNITDNWMPLKSSHTDSGNDEAGREKKDEDDLSESGEQTREEDGNDRG